MRENVDKGGEGVQKSKNFADVINGWSLMYESIYFIHPPSFMFHAFGNCEACIKFGAMSDRRTGLT